MVKFALQPFLELGDFFQNKLHKCKKISAELFSETEVLREKNINLENRYNDKILNFQKLLDDKQSSLDAFIKDKNQQIEDLKSERISVLDDVKDFLGENFKSTTHEAFDTANEKLFSQFETYFESKNKLAKKDLERIISPINDVLDQLSDANKDFAETYQRDFSSIESLVGQARKTMEQGIIETAKLSTALKGSTKSAGRWGEEQLMLSYPQQIYDLLKLKDLLL